MRTLMTKKMMLALISSAAFTIAAAQAANGQCCRVPTQETTVYESYENYPPYYYIGSSFQQTISDSYGDSWDHNVEESFPWTGSDSCYFGKGDEIPNLSTNTSDDTWPVMAGREWGYDLNAWLVSDAYYYERYYGSSTSCGLQYVQEMSIQASCTYPLYEPYTTQSYVSAPGNTLFLLLTAGYEQSFREEFSSSGVVGGEKLPCCAAP